MAKIKVAELFYSIQGEGRYMGVPSVFLRTFGCNFTCAGFGLPIGERTQEVDIIAKDIDKYKTYEELPIVTTGCDSYASWDVRFKHLSPMLTVEEIAKKCINMLPNHEWRDQHLIITGGEPLLGWQRAYPSLFECEDMKKLKNITFETNGTQMLKPELAKYLDENFGYQNVTFSVSAKLSCSGEPREQAILPDVVCQYQEVGDTYLKFVVGNQADVDEVLEVTEQYRENGFTGDVYLMPVGGEESMYHMNNRTVAELALKYGLRYSDRLQVPLFKNQWGT